MSFLDKNNIDEFWIKATEEQKREFMENCIKMNSYNRNMDKTKNFAEKIIEKPNNKKEKFHKFLESESVNGLIYAPTQVGKSAATREFIESCFRYNVPVIVSTDNKTDQQEQLYSRIYADLLGANVKMIKVSDKKCKKEILECIKNKVKRFVIFCLDNPSQIEKIIDILTSAYTRFEEMREIKKIAIIHDEADTITKDNNTNYIECNQAESHKKWLELKDLFTKRMENIDLKRVFVTATPENTVMLYKIEAPDVMKLEIPSIYTGYTKIKHFNFEDDLDINKKIKMEVLRIQSGDNYEAILYCMDRKLDDHNLIMEKLSKNVKCIVNTYNGNGICTYMRTKQMCKKFEKELEKEKYDYEVDCMFFKIKNMPIRRFYSIIKRLNQKCVITIGKDLICRGISYVSEDKSNPMTATTMFYKPGTSMHACGIVQTIGRITGCAMPTLTRKLYAPQDVYDTYTAYNKNQEMYLDKISNSPDILTNQVISELEFYVYKRNIDRPKLKLKMNMTKILDTSSDELSDSVESSEYSTSSTSEESEDSDYNEEDKMSSLIDMWWEKRTIIGKLLKFVYENENGVNERDLKNFIKNNGSKNPTQMYKHLITKGKEYRLIFERKNNITNLTKESR
jgi:hypothetical protein